jgi:hypothetical protein
MKYTVKKSFIKVVGKMWMPKATAATSIPLREYDIKNMEDDDGNITRDSVEDWLTSHSGDFSSVTDFYADIETGKGNIIIEENEYVYNDCMYQD